jgi:hypothetical protein
MRWSVAEYTAATEIEDHRRGNDRNHLMRLETDWPPDASRLETLHDAVRRR